MSQNNTERGANPMTAPPAGALEACPFCGGEPRAVYGLLSEVHYVTCDNDGCKTNGPSADSESAAIAAWNRRPALLAALRLREGWIPVSERLPLELPPANGVYETVNVLAFDGNYVHQMEFQAGVAAGKPWREFTNYGEFEPQNITHWMPLPAPPTADDLARILEEG